MHSKYQFALLLGAIVAFAQAVPTYAVIDWNWNQVPSNQKELDKAMSAYQGGEVESAITTLNNLISSPSQDPRARHILSDIYREQKRYGDAKKELQELIDSFARYKMTHNVLPAWMNPNIIKSEIGDVFLEEGNYSEALNIYHEVQSAAPTLTQPRVQIAKVYESQGDFESAKNQYKSILEMPGLSTAEKSYYTDKIAQLDKSGASKAAQGQSGGQQLTQSVGQPAGQTGMQPEMHSGMQADMQAGMPADTQAGMSADTQAGIPADTQTGMQSDMQNDSQNGSSGMSTVQFPKATPSQPRRAAAGTGPLQLATDEIVSKKYEAAITRLKVVVQKSPSNAQAHYLLAVAYASCRQFSLARGEYEATIKYTQDEKLQKLASTGLAKIQNKH